MALDQLGAQVEAAGAPEAYVEEDDVGLASAARRRASSALVVAAAITTRLLWDGQHGRQPLQDHLVVVDQKEPQRRCRPASTAGTIDRFSPMQSTLGVRRWRRRSS